MTKRPLELGDVVQISSDPAVHKSHFRGCLMFVTEPKSFGAVGVLAVPTGPRGAEPALTYYRALWSEMEYVGRAKYVPGEP